jgi:hypothetical protein
MNWSEVLLALLVSHLVGDFLFQTESQAVGKVEGLRNARSRQALLSHLVNYMAAFIPVLIWIGVEKTPGRAVVVAALIAVPHLLIDDGRMVSFWLRDIKHVPEASMGLRIAVDQSFHVVCLLGVSLVAAA